MLTPFPVVTIILTTLVVNLRHVLMSALKPWAVAAGVALVTYMTRVGGLFLMSFITPSLCVEAWLRQIPGAVLISIIAPTVFLTSLAQTLAALVTLLAAIYTKNLLVAIIAGVAAVSLLRLML